jgi:catechol 2,3-dioxygenase-like lactoylglutathione lyase family enzyme
VEPRISLITLGVRDLERSLRFYRDGLGLPTTWGTYRGVVFFQTRGTSQRPQSWQHPPEG